MIPEITKMRLLIADDDDILGSLGALYATIPM
jgi:hypothetical protein